MWAKPARDTIAGSGVEFDVTPSIGRGFEISIMTADSPRATSEPKPQIPFIDVGAGGPVALFESDPDRAAEIVRLGRQQFTGPVVSSLNAMSRLWAGRVANPYAQEIAEIAERQRGGVWFMNFCYEWGCSSGVMEDPAGPGMRMLRTLDWPFHGVGRNLVIARQAGAAGDYYNLTWPGFVGVIQAMAPGRFAIAINQAPLMRRLKLPVYADWLVNRAQVLSGRDLPPAHLLRRVFDSCRSYQEAREALAATPLAIPAIFSIAGTERQEGCVIERTQTNAVIHEAPAAITNHWIGEGLGRGKPRGIDSHGRLDMMRACTRRRAKRLDWLTYPLVNQDTRLAMVANPCTGELLVQGYEADGAATDIFDLANQTH